MLFHYYCLLCLAAYFVFPRGIFIFISFFSSRHGKKGKWRKVTFCPVECTQHVGYIFVFPDAQQKEKNRENCVNFSHHFFRFFMQFFSHAKEKEGVISLWPSLSVRRTDAREELRHFYASKCTPPPPFPLFFDGRLR